MTVEPSEWSIVRSGPRTDCWEAGGRHLPSYITAPAGSSAGRSGRRWKKASVENEAVKERGKQTEGTAWPERRIKPEGVGWGG